MAADVERLREQAQRIERLRREKERRDNRAISQETAAYEIGVSSRTYRTWESTGATLKFDNLKALAAYYDTSTGYIEHGQELPTPEPLGAPVPDDTSAQILKRLELIEEELRLLRVEQLARVMAILRRLDEASPTTEAPPRRRRA